MKKVAIIMGSDSDLGTMQKSFYEGIDQGIYGNSHYDPSSQ